MKNKSLVALIALTAAFVFFLAGYIVGMLTDRTIVLSDRGSGDDVVSTSTVTYTDGRMDINTATVNDLIQIPGIGESLAQSIIVYRENYGPFNSINDLLQVDGIGSKRLATLQEYITVTGG